MTEVHFKTNILLKNIIGKDLITDDNIAVLELVKNSYDAGSTVVELVFENVLRITSESEDESRILVCDKGSGMDKDDLINKWLNIAYSEKKGQSWQNGRRQAGNKGVGRFSCDRLGKELTIYSKTLNSVCYCIHIDWRVFEDDDSVDSQIQDIAFSLIEVPIEEILSITGWDSFEQGTILDIRCLRELWSESKLLGLKRDLEKFINPNQVFSSDGFTIVIHAPEFLESDNQKDNIINRVNGIIENKIFDRLNFRTSMITSQITDDGRYIKTKLTDRGRSVFELIESNPYNNLRNIKATIYYLNSYAKNYFTRQTGFRSVDFGSIFLFVNGFRVPPYGDQGDDWLGIERRKSLGFRRYLSTREVVGRIEINDDSDDFRIITSRSGIVHNDAFDQLSREGTPYGFFYKTFRRLERFVVEGIKWDKQGDILSEDTKDEERFQIDDFSRNKRVLSVIRKIIDLKDNEIVSLDINDDFVTEIIDQQIADSQSRLNLLLSEAREITDQLEANRLQNQLDEDSREIDSLISILNTFSPSSNTLSRIDSVRQCLDSAKEQIAAKELELETAQREKEEAEAKAFELQQKLEQEKQKNTYLLTSSRTMSEDAKGMVHHIKLIAQTLDSKIYNLYESVKEHSISTENILLALGQMKFQNDKSLKISKLITRANFRADGEEKFINVIEFIKQYLAIYTDIVESSSIEFVIQDNGVDFSKKLSTLNIAMVLDNLISNSINKHATIFSVTANLGKKGELILIISDNGDGLDRQFLSDPDSIFGLGITSTTGSGIGLYVVRSVLSEMGASIAFVGNDKLLKGATFCIIIN